jgi:hypothetical protein
MFYILYHPIYWFSLVDPLRNVKWHFWHCGFFKERDFPYSSLRRVFCEHVNRFIHAAPMAYGLHDACLLRRRLLSLQGMATHSKGKSTSSHLFETACSCMQARLWQVTRSIRCNIGISENVTAAGEMFPRVFFSWLYRNIFQLTSGIVTYVRVTVDGVLDLWINLLTTI